MKLTERLQLLKAGYSRSEIDAMINEERMEETSSDNNGETQEETPEASSNESQETEGETSDPMERLNPRNAELEATISELRKTIEEMQKINLQNSRQPEVETKQPVEVGSDRLFNALIGGNKDVSK